MLPWLDAVLLLLLLLLLLLDEDLWDGVGVLTDETDDVADSIIDDDGGD